MFIISIYFLGKIILFLIDTWPVSYIFVIINRVIHLAWIEENYNLLKFKKLNSLMGIL